MFKGTRERRHIAKGETAASMIEKAARTLGTASTSTSKRMWTSSSRT
jgi:hypothetical protein